MNKYDLEIIYLSDLNSFNSAKRKSVIVNFQNFQLTDF